VADNVYQALIVERPEDTERLPSKQAGYPPEQKKELPPSFGCGAGYVCLRSSQGLSLQKPEKASPPCDGVCFTSARLSGQRVFYFGGAVISIAQIAAGRMYMDAR
jgi:hypothetical protein